MSTHATPEFIAAYNRQGVAEQEAKRHEYALANHHPGTPAYCQAAHRLARWFQAVAEAATTCADIRLSEGYEAEAQAWGTKALRAADAAAHYQRESGRGRAVPTTRRSTSWQTASTLRSYLPRP